MLLSFVRLVLAVVLVVCTVGCAQGSETVVLDWRGSEEGYAMALAAADEWVSMCGAAIVVGRDNGGAPVGEVAGSVDGVPGKRGNTESDSDNRPLSVEVESGDEEQEVLAHEFGHALGIVNHAPAGLMAAHVPHRAHVTLSECALLPR